MVPGGAWWCLVVPGGAWWFLVVPGGAGDAGAGGAVGGAGDVLLVDCAVLLVLCAVLLVLCAVLPPLGCCGAGAVVVLLLSCWGTLGFVGAAGCALLCCGIVYGWS